ncbi:hypothetical protein PMAYCL1PPCAC_26355, partial [Pristionchus mayeri]
RSREPKEIQPSVRSPRLVRQPRLNASSLPMDKMPRRGSGPNRSQSSSDGFFTVNLGKSARSPVGGEKSETIEKSKSFSEK